MLQVEMDYNKVFLLQALVELITVQLLQPLQVVFHHYNLTILWATVSYVLEAGRSLQREKEMRK